MKKKQLLLGFGITVMLITGAIAYASSQDGTVVSSPKSFNQLNEQRPQVDGVAEKKYADVRLKANKEKALSSFKKVESIHGVYTDADAKKKQAHYKLKQLMTYQEAFDKGYTTQFIYEIAGDRMVYVVVAQSEKDLDFDGHLIKTPQITTLYDAETGERISYEWKSADPTSDKVIPAPTAADTKATIDVPATVGTAAASDSKN
jgi:hypothetical protein